MTLPDGTIDCDIHPPAPPMAALMPYVEPFWRDQLVLRHLDRMRFDWTGQGRRHAAAVGDSAGQGPLQVAQGALAKVGSSAAICNVMHGAAALYQPDMAAAILRALNDWVAAELLGADPRLFGSVAVTLRDPAFAVAEIERLAGDPRFVQVLLPVSNEMPIGRRPYWPVFEAAQRAGMPVCLHAGSLMVHAPTPSGWPSFFAEDEVAQSAGFEAAVGSLLSEGVFDRFPDLTFVLAESGVSWLPPFLWKQDKLWPGVRTEVPWIGRLPRDILRERLRLTLQPLDAPADPDIVARLVEQLESEDILLFSSDHPHVHDAPVGLGEALLRRICTTNPRAVYRRMASAGAERAAS